MFNVHKSEITIGCNRMTKIESDNIVREILNSYNIIINTINNIRNNESTKYTIKIIHKISDLNLKTTR